MKCSKCGAEVSGKFCPDCGAAVLEQPVGEPQTGTIKKKKKPVYKRVWFWIVIGIVGLSILIAKCGGNSDSFSEGYEAGREAARQGAEPAADVTAEPKQKEAQETPTTTPEEEDNSWWVDVNGEEFGLDINGNPGPNRYVLISCAETSMKKILLTSDVKLTYWFNNAGTFDISKTNLRYIIIGTCKINDIPYEVIIKLEFDETYETYTVFQLKLDGKNIDL